MGEPIAQVAVATMNAIKERNIFVSWICLNERRDQGQIS